MMAFDLLLSSFVTMEHHPMLLIKWFLFIILMYSTYLTSSHSFIIPRLSPFDKWKTTLQDRATFVAKDTEQFKTFYYKQVLDHFNHRPESYKTFQQRYVINFKYWGSANSSAPIFAYFGAETPIDDDPEEVGFLTDNAASFNALLVYIEHRYYGKSIPFGSREEAFKNASTFGYFNSAQAIADYASVLIHVKKTLHAQKSPVIVIGASYGGMIASWFRLKYPHLTIGALASSAPILYFDNIITPQDGYFSVVTRDFREASETCYQTILKSWSEIDRVASQPKGISILSKKFNFPLNKSSDLKDFLVKIYARAAQYNAPPTYPVTAICGAIDRTVGSDILSQIQAGFVAYWGNITYNVNGLVQEFREGWGWQTCSEMVIPLAIGNNTMFQPDPFNFQSFAKDCKKQYGVLPRPHWITTYYGGHNIKLVLQRFGSNIIFSNGLKDPYSSGGVLKNLSESLVAITTVNGSHCLDLAGAQENDPEWLVEQRKKEIAVIKKWIAQYYADLAALKDAPKF